MHADAMGKCIDPNVPELEVLGVEETGKCIVCALYQIAIALVFCIDEEILVIVWVIWSVEMQPFLEMHESLAHVFTHEWLTKEEGKEVASRNVPSEGILSTHMFRCRDKELNKARVWVGVGG